MNFNPQEAKPRRLLGARITSTATMDPWIARNFKILIDELNNSNPRLLGPLSPALIANNRGQDIIAFCAKPIGNIINIPPIVVMGEAAARFSLPDLKGHGFHLFVIGDKNGNFEGMGAVSNFAPSYVHVLRHTNRNFKIHLNPGNRDYREKLGSTRDVQFRDYELGDLAPNESPTISTISLNTPFSFRSNTDRKEDPQLEALNIRYKEIEDIFRGKYIDITNPKDPDLAMLMRILHHLACDNVALDGGPFAAAVLEPTGRLVSVGSNRVFANSDPLIHGEISATERALNLTRRKDLEGFSLVTTSQTCIGCAESCCRIGIKNIVFGNTAVEVEANTLFTEGPLDPNFFTHMDISQLALPNSSNFDAFNAFNERGKLYLTRSK